MTATPPAKDPSDYTVAVIADVHADRPYALSGSLAGHTRYGNGNADALKNLHKIADAIIVAGDFAGNGHSHAPRVKPPRRGREKPEHKISDRDSIAVLTEFREKNAAAERHSIVGNHEGRNASDLDSPVVQAMEKLSHTDPDFHYSDNVRMGNLLVLHGNDFIHSIHYGSAGKGYEVGTVLGEYGIVEAEDNKGLARKMCEVVPTVKKFIEEQTFDLPRNGKMDLYVFFAHTHRHFDESFALPSDPRVTMHVTNLGCLLPGRKANYKLVHMKEGAVERVEPLLMPLQKER